MTLLPGAVIGTCEILAPLDSESGELYRARDRESGIEVAVKVLPASLASDPESLNRFERYWHVLNGLGHPNLPRVHRVERLSGSAYLILELFPGDLVTPRKRRRGIPLLRALEISAQVAAALDVAHQHGVVHGSLRSSDVRVGPDGRVTVLRFGEERNTPAEHQTRGIRDDIFAFGCLMFELLAGGEPFPAAPSGIGSADRVEAPDWTQLPATTPPQIRRLLEAALHREPSSRLRDIGDAANQIADALDDVKAAVLPQAVHLARRRRLALLTAVAATALVSTAVTGARLYLSSAPDASPDASLADRLSQALRPQAPRPASVRFDLVPPSSIVGGFHISPDGLKVAFVTRAVEAAGVPSRIWTQAFDSREARSIQSSAGAAPQILWSSDSAHIAFFADGKLKRVPAAGGPATIVTDLPASGNYRGDWNGDVILVASDARTGGPLLRVSAEGGKLAPATTLESANEVAHAYPNFLPDGRHFFYLARTADDGVTGAAAFVGTLDSPERHPLATIGSEVKYLNGHALFVRDGALMAQPFDAERFHLTGEAFPIADPFVAREASSGPFSASRTGTLLFRSNSASPPTETELVWVDRNGSRSGVVGVRGEYGGPEVSRDGRFVAFTRGVPRDIWILDAERGSVRRITSDPADDYNPRWSPDGSTIAFSSTRGGELGVFTRNLAAMEDTLVRLTPDAGPVSDWSRDGRFVLFTSAGDVWAQPLNGDAPIQVTSTPFAESVPRVSPDGRWVAYVSDEKGPGQPVEVFVQSFPSPGTKRVVSSGGGLQPRWTDHGEVVYLRSLARDVRPGQLMVSAVNASGGSLQLTEPAPLFLLVNRETTPTGTVTIVSTSYAVTAADRFLIQIIPYVPRNFVPPASTRGITMVLNWSGLPGI
jgi:Tol biopolymer transport system component